MVAGLAFVGCSSEEDIAPGNNGGELSEPQFLTVNIMSHATGGANAARDTRAGGDQMPGDPEDATYEEGLKAENKVKKVRFYFFHENGNPAQVSNHNGTMKNWLEWENIIEEGTDMPNVENILTATLIIQSPKGDVDPALVVAVINPTETPNEERSLASLATVAHNYKRYITEGTFVMSNSTYKGDGAKQMAVSVAGHLEKTSGEALNNPVEIFVERVVAKVRLKSSLIAVAGKDGIYQTWEEGSDPQTVTVDGVEKNIYVKFLGWNTTAVSNKSRLVKEINASWQTDLFGSTAIPWNWADYFRCFWAINANGVDYEYGAFVSGENIKDNLFQAQAKKNFDKTDWVYVNENASPYIVNPMSSDGANAAKPTKVIIAAQLVDEDGNPLEFAEYGSTRTSIDGLKNLFANNCGLYKKETVTEGTETVTTFVKITPAELTVKTASAISDKEGEAVEDRYKSYVQLADGENVDDKWYLSTAQDAQPISAVEANKLLKNMGSVKVWAEGNTYYFFDIKHLGNKIGVVRNHIYDANITKLVGLGTPVYDPEEIIYPEKPENDDDTFIAAKINILSWRVVNSDIDLEW